MYRYTKLSLLAITIATSGAMAYAASVENPNDALVITGAKTTLTQAITTAEQHVHGTASRAEIEESKQGLIYDVEVVRHGQVFDVRVDAEQGTIIASALDKSEHDDDQDQQD